MRIKIVCQSCGFTYYGSFSLIGERDCSCSNKNYAVYRWIKRKIKARRCSRFGKKLRARKVIGWYVMKKNMKLNKSIALTVISSAPYCIVPKPVFHNYPHSKITI